MPASLAIIFVHYHTPKLLENAVRALRADCIASSLNCEIIIVDNGSGEEDQELLDSLACRLIKAPENLGYAGGVNLGADNTTSDLLVFMNPDVVVLPGCLANLVQALMNGASAAGPRFYWDMEKTLMLPPTEVRSRGDELLRAVGKRSRNWEALTRRRWRRHARRHWLAEKAIVSYELSGALLAVRRDALKTIGPFDTGFKLYFEETDWLMRLKHSRLKAFYVPQAEAVHFYNQSAIQEPLAGKWLADSAARFDRRYYGKWFCDLRNKFQASEGFLRSDLNQLPPGPPEIEIPSGKRYRLPLWVAISVMPQLYPAAGGIIGELIDNKWAFPEAIWRYLAPGHYFLQMVDDTGAELARYKLVRD